MKRQAEAYASFDIFDDRGSSRADITKVKVVPSMPDLKLANAKDVDKDTGNNKELRRAKTKRGMMIDQRRSQIEKR